jgi:hypothetical protein
MLLAASALILILEISIFVSVLPQKIEGSGMENKTSVLIMVFLILTLLLNVCMLVMLQLRGGIIGFSVKTPEKEPVLEEDIIELNRADLNKCCSFTNLIGEEDSCYMLKGHDCSYCAQYCGSS